MGYEGKIDARRGSLVKNLPCMQLPPFLDDLKEFASKKIVYAVTAFMDNFGHPLAIGFLLVDDILLPKTNSSAKLMDWVEKLVNCFL